MDHSDGSHTDSTFDTSNLSFANEFFEDHRSDSSSSLDEQNDTFEDEDGETERKFVPSKQQIDELAVGTKLLPTTAVATSTITTTTTTAAATTATTLVPSTSSAAEQICQASTTNGETTCEQGDSGTNNSTARASETFAVPDENAQRKRKSIFDLFPWLNEVNHINQQCLGSIIELRNARLLDVMDFLIRYLST